MARLLGPNAIVLGVGSSWAAVEKATTAIAKSHGVVAMEDLRVRQMTASARGTLEKPGRNVAAKAGLNRTILDVAPGAVRVRLGQKLAACGGVQLLVPSAHTSQRCSRCDHIESANRESRGWFVCLACGHEQDADENAGCNIRDRARGLWGDASKVQVAASLALLLAQQARPKRSFNARQHKRKQTTGGLPVQACASRGLRHGNCRKRTAATRSSSPAIRAARSSVPQGRE